MANVFEQVVNYVSNYDSGFYAGIVGASPSNIAELENEIGISLPPIYKDFLLTMGISTDWIAVRHIDFSIKTVLNYYRRERWLSPNLYLRIGVEEGEPRFHPHLDMIANPVNPPILAFPASPQNSLFETVARFGDPVAGTLDEMICSPVFSLYELTKNGRKPIELSSDYWRAKAIDEVEEGIDPLAFEDQFFSNLVSRAYRNREAAIRTFQFPGYPLRVFISADDHRIQDEMLSGIVAACPELKRR